MNLKTGVSRKQSMPNFPKNEHLLPPDTHMYVCISGGKKCLFFGKLGVLCFLETSVLRFTLLPYYSQTVDSKSSFLVALGVLDSPLREIKMSKLNKQHISETGYY